MMLYRINIIAQIRLAALLAIAFAGSAMAADRNLLEGASSFLVGYEEIGEPACGYAGKDFIPPLEKALVSAGLHSDFDPDLHVKISLAQYKRPGNYCEYLFMLEISHPTGSKPLSFNNHEIGGHQLLKREVWMGTLKISELKAQLPILVEHTISEAFKKTGSKSNP